MGRTLHYTVRTLNGNKFTAAECNFLNSFSVKMNSGAFKDVWTCENFYIDPCNYYPNWKHFDKSEVNNAWSVINKRYDILIQEGFEHQKAVKAMVKEKLVVLHKEISNEVYGFTKVQGNEFNAMLVYTALIELSKALKVEISLRDEGYFLLCDLKIREGKVLPDLVDILSDIRRWSSHVILREDNSKHNELLSAKVDKEFLRDVFSNYPVENCNKYLEAALDKYKEVCLIIQKNWQREGTMICRFNLNNMPIKDWFSPELFCRKINKDDFKEYKMSPATLMAGFYGEYWNKENTDSEKTSYEMISKIIETLNIKGNKDLKMTVLGESGAI